MVDESSDDDLRGLLTIIIDEMAIRNVYLDDERTREYLNRFDELSDIQITQYDETTKVEQIAEYIGKYRSTLLPVFAKDFIRSLSIASKGYVEHSRAALYGQVADCLCQLSTRNFHTAIRESPKGELHFKEQLYKIKCYEHLAYYGELTFQLLVLFFAKDFNTEDIENIEQTIVPRIISVASRPVLEQLYDKLMSKCASHRLLAGRLMVQLALCDAISAQESK